MKTARRIVFSTISLVCFLLMASTAGFSQIKPYTGGPNSNGTASVFFAVDGTTTPLSNTALLPGDEITIRAYIDLTGLSGTDDSSNPIAVSLSSIHLLLTYDTNVLQLVSPTFATSGCTSSSLNPIFVGASGRFNDCSTYSVGKDGSGNFSPNSTGIISMLSYTTDTSGLPTGLVALPAFKFHVQNVAFSSTIISLVAPAESPTSFAGASYSGADSDIDFVPSDLHVLKRPTSGSGTVAISGSEQSYSDIHGMHYDSGTVSITVNGYTASVPYSDGSTSSSIATALASKFNSDPTAPVTATLSGSTLTLTARQPGANTNYSLSTAITYNTFFPSASFSASPSGSNLTGGS